MVGLKLPSKIIVSTETLMVKEVVTKQRPKMPLRWQAISFIGQKSKTEKSPGESSGSIGDYG
jgi:hypothetical protein